MQGPEALEAFLGAEVRVVHLAEFDASWASEFGGLDAIWH